MLKYATNWGDTMRVYRCLTAREIENIFKGEKEVIPLIRGNNTHQYDTTKSYIHFFRYSQSAEFYHRAYIRTCDPLDNYIAYMVANIPNEILRQYIGYGFYPGVEPFYEHNIPLPEYAIPEELFKKEYIVRINNFINYEYQSNSDEYQKYLELVGNLLKNYNGNINYVAGALHYSNLEELLEVIDDDRTENQIKEDYQKILSKNYHNKLF